MAVVDEDDNINSAAAEETELAQFSKEKQKEAKGVDSVSDFVDEKEGTTDAAALSVALGSIESSMEKKSAIVVQLAEEDVKIITEECEISKDAAEALLRNFNGNLKEALRSYIAGQ